MKALLPILLLLFSGTALAQPSQKGPDTAASPAKTTLTATASEKMTESEYYRKLYEQAVISEGKFIDQSDKTLTYVLTIIGILAAAQIIYNYVISERQIAKVRAEIDAEVSRRLEAQNTDTRNTIAGRIFESQTAFKEVINREIDNYKIEINGVFANQEQRTDSKLLGITKRLNLIQQDFALRDARFLLERGEAFNALQIYLRAAEVKIQEDVLDANFFMTGTNFFSKMDEIQKADADRMEEIMIVLKEKEPVTHSFWKHWLEKLPIYQVKTVGKEYLKNAPN